LRTRIFHGHVVSFRYDAPFSGRFNVARKWG
jgi:hypothetical protein